MKPLYVKPPHFGSLLQTDLALLGVIQPLRAGYSNCPSDTRPTENPAGSEALSQDWQGSRRRRRALHIAVKDVTGHGYIGK